VVGKWGKYEVFLYFLPLVFIISLVKGIIRQTTGKLLKGLTGLVYHKYCRICDCRISQDDEYFCSDCWQGLNGCIVDSHCTRCGKEISAYAKLPTGCPNCQEQTFHFDSIACIGVYREPLRSLIINFKLADKTNLLRPIADLTRGTIERAKFSEPIDFVVPVPLHWRRRFKRGFNQSALIAKSFSLPDAKFNTDLVRVRYTTQQAMLTDAERQKNIKDAFAVRKSHNFSGKNVCLVDDVKTTGATLNECARVLKDAGANKVFAFVLAVARQKDT
jgi:ComF family protein